ncbi:hypothetical protein [Brachybacterium sp. ACRRE]|uniref:hypothetical protein n=1 Tax=Brachybacterium sp. ACRRE TaxID=2918184 RepID=UPI001EF3C344|nr:hypothetical protein [Brachybacterium sp. ACRRE]MCG7310531.1 hypothetical protein [Brachybacterium sp. ACRRE]
MTDDDEAGRTMIIACYARTLRPGISLDDFIAAWMPPGRSEVDYPVRCRLATDPLNPRSVLSLFEIDAPSEKLAEIIPTLVHPDSEARLERIVETTALAGVFEVDREFGGDVPAEG